MKKPEVLIKMREQLGCSVWILICEQTAAAADRIFLSLIRGLDNTIYIRESLVALLIFLHDNVANNNTEYHNEMNLTNNTLKAIYSVLPFLAILNLNFSSV